MAIIKGPFKFSGPVGDLSFADTRFGVVMKTKSVVPTERLKKGIEFERTRENNTEFGRAIAAAKLIRNTLVPHFFNACDPDVFNRLTSRLMKVLHADEVNKRGGRTVEDGDLFLLDGFEFNIRSPLRQRFFQRFAVSLDRDKGLLALNTGRFLAHCAMQPPVGTTHFRLLLSASTLAFGDQLRQSVNARTEMLLFRQEWSGPLTLQLDSKDLGELPVVAAVGIEFYELLKDGNYPVEKGQQDALAIVGVF